MQGRTAGGAGRGGARKPGGATGAATRVGRPTQRGRVSKWGSRGNGQHLLHPLSVWQSQVTPVVGRQGRGSGAGRRGIEVVVVVATATAKGQPACARGEVGWVLACHGGVQWACVEEVSCTVKDEGEKGGMTYLRFF